MWPLEACLGAYPRTVHHDRPLASSAPNGVEDADAHPVEWVRAMEGETVKGGADVVRVSGGRG